jgi:hypothetical protein
VHTLNLEVFIDKLQPKTIISHVCWRHYVKLLATTATNPANFISWWPDSISGQVWTLKFMKYNTQTPVSGSLGHLPVHFRDQYIYHLGQQRLIICYFILRREGISSWLPIQTTHNMQHLSLRAYCLNMGHTNAHKGPMIADVCTHICSQTYTKFQLCTTLSYTWKLQTEIWFNNTPTNSYTK